MNKALITIAALVVAVTIGVGVMHNRKTTGTEEEPTESADTIKMLNNLPPDLADAVAERFSAALEEQALPFLDQDRLDEIRNEIRDLVANTPQPNMNPERRNELLLAIGPYVSDYFPTPRTAKQRNQIYLEFPDRLKTFEWKLWLALRREPLAEPAQEQFAQQIEWMKRHILSLPEKAPSYTHAATLARFDALCNDPLCPVFHEPFTADQFEEFKRNVTSDKARSALLHVVHLASGEALFATHEPGEDFALPFDDKVGDRGVAGGLIKLGFMSNLAFRSRELNFGNIERNGSIYDLDKGSIGVPDTARHAEAFQRWLDERGQGDFIYDDAEGGALVGVRAAKLAMLDVPDWLAADLVPAEELRALIAEKGQRTVSLQDAAARCRADSDTFRDAGGAYVAVLTGDDKLAVVQITDFGKNSVGIRVRKRPEKAAKPTPSAPEPAERDTPPAQETAAPSKVDEVLAQDTVSGKRRLFHQYLCVRQKKPLLFSAASASPWRA